MIGSENNFDVSMAWWRNGSASDSRSEGCVFKSRPGQSFSICEATIGLILCSRIITQTLDNKTVSIHVYRMT